MSQNNDNKLAKFYIVATPIGNLKDITLRAIEILSQVDYIVCEDTRTTNKLLSSLNIAKKLICYNDHSDENNRNGILQLLNNGSNIALVSDAGTPLINDPGFKLVKLLEENNIYITTIPGPCSLIAALTLSSIASDKFYFAGFLPPKTGSRVNFLQTLQAIPGSLIFFEAARRLVSSLTDIKLVFAKRQIAVVREITKIYEECKKGSPDEILDYYLKNPPKGEVVIIISPPNKKNSDNLISDLDLTNLIAQHGIKKAVNILCDKTGQNKKFLYELALKLSGKK